MDLNIQESEKVFSLDYMHYNPLQPHWQLSNEPADYKFSSANFMKPAKMNLKYLHITWISYNLGMAGEDTRQVMEYHPPLPSSKSSCASPPKL